MEASSIYTDAPWMQTPPVLSEGAKSYEDSLTGEALSATLGEPADSVRLRRPPIPVKLFPPRFGYRTDPIRIQDVATLDNLYERHDFSGRKSGYEGSSTPSLPVF